MSQEKHFHFTLGPVQGFVSQARRIRDFWAGSFLLSWLAAVAMRSVEAQGGTIEFPTYDKDYMAWLEGNGADNPPRQGGVPNRFMAKVPDGFDAKQVSEAVQKVWETLADEVWQADLKHLENSETKEIWDRQIKSFWEISWVVTEGDDETAMDRRKNWRNYALPVEEGLPCSLMDGWVELSGEKKPGQAVRAFWEPLRKQLGRDLNEREQLCAIAFVKRRFAGVFHQVQPGWKLNDMRIPSINDIAAAHWLERLLVEPNYKEFLQPFYKQALAAGVEQRGNSLIRCIQEACDTEAQKNVARLNGEGFFADALRNSRSYEQGKEINDLIQLLRKVKDKGLMPPSPYYAILLMDGDNMGKALRDDDPKTISKALLKFNKATDDLVFAHNGFLIYAGGDDVLALLPVEDALACAYQLHEAYAGIMRASAPATTLSGAIQFAHVKTPLTLLLQDAHDLLDNIAKKQHGRDSLAVRVWNHGGQGLEWAMPWTCAADENGLILQQLLEDFQNKDGEGGQFSSGFFYKIREFFQKNSELPVEVQQALLVSAYLASGKSGEKDLDAATRQVEKLFRQCKRLKRDAKTRNCEPMKPAINPDGALLLRFLSKKTIG